MQSAPHSEVLKDAALMITHAGHGSVVKALAAGVPIVAMPFGRDQLEIAARAAYTGAAVKISPKARPGEDRRRGPHGARRRLLPRGRQARGADDRRGERERPAAEALEQLAGTPRSSGGTGDRVLMSGVAV